MNMDELKKALRNDDELFKESWRDVQALTTKISNFGNIKPSEISSIHTAAQKIFNDRELSSSQVKALQDLYTDSINQSNLSNDTKTLLLEFDSN